jgi:hypothetical protein
MEPSKKRKGIAEASENPNWKQEEGMNQCNDES